MCFGITPLNACRCFTNICFVPLVIFIVAHAILLFSRFFLGRLFMFDIWFGSWSIRLMNKSSVEQQQLINQLFNAHVTWMIFILWYLHRQARNGFEKPKHIEWTWTNEHKFINFKSEIKIYILRRNKICVVVCLYVGFSVLVTNWKCGIRFELEGWFLLFVQMIDRIIIQIYWCSVDVRFGLICV